MPLSKEEQIGLKLENVARGLTLLGSREVKTLLDSFYPHARQIKYWWVIHSAAHQTSEGADLILDLAWHDPKWRSMFNDPTYVNNWDKQVWETIQYPRERESHIRTEIFNACSKN